MGRSLTHCAMLRRADIKRPRYLHPQVNVNRCPCGGALRNAPADSTNAEAPGVLHDLRTALPSEHKLLVPMTTSSCAMV